MPTPKVPWSYDFKKIHVLNYLQVNNATGGIRATFLRMSRRGIIGAINPNEIDRILVELLNDQFIRKEENAAGVIYFIEAKGTMFLAAIQEIKRINNNSKFFFLDALDEPTDRVQTR